MTDAERRKVVSGVLEEGMGLFNGDRARTHGDLKENMQCIADFWSVYHRHRIPGPLEAHEVCDLMALLKIARRLSGEANRDDYTDGAVYAAMGWGLAGEEETSQ